MKRKKMLQGILVLLFIISVTGCRLGEIMSEADPETQSEIEKKEAIPQNEEIDNDAGKSGV